MMNCVEKIAPVLASAPDANQARRSTLYAAALCFPLGIALALIGVAGKFLHPTTNSLYALPVFLQSMNPLVAGLVTTSLVALVIAVVPLVFVFFVPAILKLSFFTRALRLSISIVAVIGFYLPFFHSGRGATLGLLASAGAHLHGAHLHMVRARQSLWHRYHVCGRRRVGCVWFGGTQEGIPDVSVYFSRLAAGSDRWSEPESCPTILPAPNRTRSCSPRRTARSG